MDNQGNQENRPRYLRLVECPKCHLYADQVVEAHDEEGHGECPYCDKSFNFELK